MRGLRDTERICGIISARIITARLLEMVVIDAAFHAGSLSILIEMSGLMMDEIDRSNVDAKIDASRCAVFLSKRAIILED